MIIPSRLELLNQKELLKQASFGKDLLERQLAYLLNSLRKMSKDVTTSWKKLIEKDKTAMISLSQAISKESSYVEETAKLQPERTIANVLKEQTAGLTIPKIEIVDIMKKKEEISIPLMFSFAIDASTESFQEYYNEILNYIEIIINLQRLAKKIKKTKRQLSILEKELIPELKENINLIRFTLNQRELEDKIRLLKISKKFSGK